MGHRIGLEGAEMHTRGLTRSSAGERLAQRALVAKKCRRALDLSRARGVSVK